MSTAMRHLDGLSVPVETAGASRKAKPTIGADGSLRLRAAGDVATDELTRFLASKRDWVYRKLAEREVLEHEPITKELADGEGSLYLARSDRLKLARTDGAVRLERGRLVMPGELASDGPVHLIAWSQRCGETWLRPRVRLWAERLRVESGAIEVADLGHKWGSATAGRRVRHWATLQLSPELVAYVLAHELAHLREAHHGPDLWQLLARVMPDYDERKRELAKRGASLWFGGLS